MKNYFENLNDELKAYFKILSPEIPEFLRDYIDVPEMERISKISMFCGKDYAEAFGTRYFISNLDHSVGVALIIWHFTHDKKQTIAGLYHDIATPVFKHCIDFMNGDSEKQESTEEKTLEMLKNSKEIMALLERDNIELDEIADYKKYPIADNDVPRLSADRFEYHFTNGLSLSPVFTIEEIKEFYNNVIVAKNEDNIDELCFKDIDICEKYTKKASMLWHLWADELNNVFMNFLGDVCKAMAKKGYLKVADLYVLSEAEIIEKIRNCEDEYISSRFKEFQTTRNVFVSPLELKESYSVKLKAKRRYINPLVITTEGIKRIHDVSSVARIAIDSYLESPFDGYGCFDFDFKV